MSGLLELQSRLRLESAKNDVCKVLCLFVYFVLEQKRGNKDVPDTLEFLTECVYAIAERYGLPEEQVIELLMREYDYDALIKFAKETKFFENLASSIQ